MQAYTIVSRAYVPHARVLARSFNEVHPEGEFWALLIDDIAEEIDPVGEPFRVLRLTDLDVDPAELHRMAMLFSGRIIAAIKPWVFEHLLGLGADSAIYLDSDMVVFASLEPLADAARTHGVVVVPHVVTAMPRDGRLPSETTLLGVGSYNGGCFGVGRSGGAFIEFLKVRLRRECHTDVPGMRVNEQRWLDFVPALFDHEVLRDPGVDVAPWNIHERPLTKAGDRWMVGDGPLRLFHFSGFDPRVPSVMSARDFWDHPRVPMGDAPALALLYADYVSALVQSGFEASHQMPFAYDFLPDGTPVYASLRRLYAETLRLAEAGQGQSPPDPFDAEAVESFRTWARQAYRDARERTPQRLRDDHPDVAEGGEDWLGRMRVLPSGRRDASGVVRFGHGPAGEVLDGPHALLEAGRYRVVTDLWIDEEPADGGRDVNAILIEVLLDGFALQATGIRARGACAATNEFVITRDHQQLALSAGIELRIQSRSALGGSVDSVLMERLGDVEGSDAGQLSDDWLVAMSVGDIGTRTGASIVAVADRAGVLAEGPRWRLDQGRYLVELGLRSGSSPSDRGSTVVALVDVVVHGYVLGFQPVTWEDLRRGRTAFEFDVGGRWADDRYTLIELRVRLTEGVDAELTSVSIVPTGPVGTTTSPANGDWLPALQVGGIGSRFGREVHTSSPGPGVLAQGPGWRLEPGRYEVEVQFDPVSGMATGDPSEVALVLQVLLDGLVRAERKVSPAEIGESAGTISTVILSFDVEARKVPAPLNELTPVTDLVISSGGAASLRIHSAVVTQRGDTT